MHFGKPSNKANIADTNGELDQSCLHDLDSNENFCFSLICSRNFTKILPRLDLKFLFTSLALISTVYNSFIKKQSVVINTRYGFISLLDI